MAAFNVKTIAYYNKSIIFAKTAMNVFAKAVVQRRCIPFEIKANDEPMEGFTAFREIRKMAESGQLPDLSLDEINNEIKKTRISRQ